MKLCISAEYGKFTVVGWRSSSPNTLSEIKRLRRNRLMTTANDLSLSVFWRIFGPQKN
jgi:hypothetical protein